jgi:hypothetical protein
MDALRSGNWKAMIGHYTVFGEDGCHPKAPWQDLEVGINGRLNNSVIAAFAAARLALTRDARLPGGRSGGVRKAWRKVLRSSGTGRKGDTVRWT